MCFLNFGSSAVFLYLHLRQKFNFFYSFSVKFTLPAKDKLWELINKTS